MFTPPDIPKKDVDRLRDLARRVREIADLPVMEARRRMWTDVNDARPGARPPFAIETWTFSRDFWPPGLWQCESEYARRWEGRLLGCIRHHEVIGDDQVCPRVHEIYWHASLPPFAGHVPTTGIKDSQGVYTGYSFDHPIKDLSAAGALDIIQPCAYSVDREGTLAELAFARELLGDALEIRIGCGGYGFGNLSFQALRLLGTDAMFTAMMDCPDTFHRLMALAVAESLRRARWAEAEGLLALNNENHCTCGTCFNYTTKLPREGHDPRRVRLRDLWLGMDAQETVGLGPAQFKEFFYPYYAEVAREYGFVYFGCCEALDPIWDSLGQLPNLRAVSVSRWADEPKLAGLLQGRDIVYSRKPNPNLLGVDVRLDEGAWREEIRRTLAVTVSRGIPTEFVVRDVYTLHGDLSKASRAVALAREEIDRFYPPAGA